MSSSDTTVTPPVLWMPAGDDHAMGEFACFAAERSGLRIATYDELHHWSVTDPDAFWTLAADWLGVRFHERAERALPDARMPGARWFPGATLNYAEQALEAPGAGDAIAVRTVREDGVVRDVQRDELRALVAAAREGLRRLGVERGDRVVAVMPNSLEALVAFLATASLGAVWSSCSPDFGPKAVEDRFIQLKPVVLVTVDGYMYGGREFDLAQNTTALRAALPGLRATVVVPYVDSDVRWQGCLTWNQLLAVTAPMQYEVVPFEHPLWVLFSSGTTGLPKGIVQGHGGIVLEHLKMLRLHHDLRAGEGFLWFTTTGWMMWNYLVSGLMVGAVVVLYDGSPAYPDLGAVWRVVAAQGVALFGASAPYVHASMRAGIEPRDAGDLSALRAFGSTGSPLSPDGFRWLAEHVGSQLQICSVSGGTDVCTAFLGSAPNVPVWQGELSCAALGADVHAFSADGTDLEEEVGELVLLKPMPSMPVSFWNDEDGQRMREAYFEMYPGVWRHGDWVKRSSRGSFVIFGRSDATLNRGGVRMGTADFYAVVEGFPGILDSLVVDTTALGAAAEGELLCFVVPAPGVDLAGTLPALRAALRTQLSPRHVPDRFISIAAVPRTLSGKKCEVPVKRILAGVPAEAAVSRDALADPSALDFFVRMAAEGQRDARA